MKHLRNALHLLADSNSTVDAVVKLFQYNQDFWPVGDLVTKAIGEWGDPEPDWVNLGQELERRFGQDSRVRSIVETGDSAGFSWEEVARQIGRKLQLGQRPHPRRD